MERHIQHLQSGLKLGEGPVWDASGRRLAYVDIERCRVVSIAPDGQDPVSLSTCGMVGCVVPTKNGKLLAAAGHSLVELDFINRTQTEHATFEFPEYIRFNDGKCDMHGNLWVGTMAADQSHPEAHDCGSLLCIARGKIIAEYHGFGVPNGMAWSDDGKTFYHIDTPTRKIDAYTVGEGGLLGEKRPALLLPQGGGVPDGMCADEAGNLWIALWGAGCVVCYDPRTQRKLDEVMVEDTNTSCCTFGGAALQTLYITTAQDQNGRGGSLFATEIPARGKLPFSYGGLKDES